MTSPPSGHWNVVVCLHHGSIMYQVQKKFTYDIPSGTVFVIVDPATCETWMSFSHLIDHTTFHQIFPILVITIPFTLKMFNHWSCCKNNLIFDLPCEKWVLHGYLGIHSLRSHQRHWFPLQNKKNKPEMPFRAKARAVRFRRQVCKNTDVMHLSLFWWPPSQ